MWNTSNWRRLTRSRFTRSVNGRYQHIGPQGMMARVFSPRPLCRVISLTSSWAMSWPISAESLHSRNGIFRSGWCSSASLASLAPTDRDYVTTTDDSGYVTGYGLNLTGSYKVGQRDRVMGQFAYGKGIAAYFNDCCVDIAPNAAGKAEAVPAVGWLVYYDHFWNERFSSAIGWSNSNDSTWRDFVPAPSGSAKCAITASCRPKPNRQM